MDRKHSWTVKQVRSAKKPDYGKKFVVEDVLLSLTGNLEGKKLLELGCGNGYWIRILEQYGAQCVGIDISKNQIAEAQLEKERIGSKATFMVGDASKSLELNEFFDIILLEHVLLEVPSLAKLRAVFRNVSNCLALGGKVIVSDLHPFSVICGLPDVKTIDDMHYFRTGTIFEAISNCVDGETTLYRDYHWTLEDRVAAMTDAGLKISKLLEPRPTEDVCEKYPELRYRLRVPTNLFLVGEK